MLSQDESVAFRERNNGDQCISSRRGTALYVYVCTLKYKSLKGYRWLVPVLTPDQSGVKAKVKGCTEALKSYNCRFKDALSIFFHVTV